MDVKAKIDRIEAAVAAKRSQGIAPPSFYEIKGSDFSGLETFWVFLNEFHESLAEVVNEEHADALLTAMLEQLKTKNEK